MRERDDVHIDYGVSGPVLPFDRIQALPLAGQLFTSFVENNVPSSCVIPSGLGKTHILAVWLITRADPSRPPVYGLFGWSTRGFGYHMRST
jgi:hypothetical protein